MAAMTPANANAAEQHAERLAAVLREVEPLLKNGPRSRAAMALAAYDEWRHDDTADWCVLCDMSPMPVASRLPDGCYAHPGCVTDPVFAKALLKHKKGAHGDG